MVIWEGFINPHLEADSAGDVLSSSPRPVAVDVKEGAENVTVDDVLTSSPRDVVGLRSHVDVKGRAVPRHL